MPCDYLPVENWSELDQTSKERRRKVPISHPNNEKETDKESDDDSENEIDITYHHQPLLVTTGQERQDAERLNRPKIILQEQIQNYFKLCT